MSAFVWALPEHKLRVIAPDVGGGFGSKIFLYPEETVCIWARRRSAGPCSWTAERSESFLSDAHGRDHVTTAELALDGNGKFLALRVKTIANIGAYLSHLRVGRPDHSSTRRCSPASTRRRRSIARSTACSPTPRRSTPIAAPDGPRRRYRRRAASSKSPRASCTSTRPRSGGATSSPQFPYQTPVASLYDTGDYDATLDKAIELADVKGFGERKAESERRGKLRGIGFASYIEACGLAPSNVAGALGAAPACSKSAKCACTRPAW